MVEVDRSVYTREMILSEESNANIIVTLKDNKPITLKRIEAHKTEH